MNPWEKKSVAVIGAGIAGLSAGIALKKGGVDAVLFESHTLPGGQCTSWKRGDFTFDGCLHWVVGTGKGRLFHSLLSEIGALDRVSILNHDRYMTVSIPGGRSITLYTDINLTEKELLEKCPQDHKEILRLMRGARIAARVRLPEPGDYAFLSVLRFLASLPGLVRLWKWSKISAREYSERFRDPLMQKAIMTMFAPGFSMLFNLFTMAWLQNQNGGYPLGGSMEFVRGIEDRFLELGGEIRYRSRVTEILVERDFACGIVLEDGSVHRFDGVISASDGHQTVEKLLKNRYHNPALKSAWEQLPLFDPLFYISLGIKGRLGLDGSVSGQTVFLAEPAMTSFGPVDHFLIHPMDFDSTLAPEGKSVVELMVNTSWDAWKNEDRNSESYKIRKESDARAILAAMEREYYPDLTGRIEEIDIATPLTWVRYTNVYHGAFEGIQLTPDVFRMGMSMPKRLNGLSRFYLCGQWVEAGGGVSAVAQSGKLVAGEMIRELGKA